MRIWNNVEDRSARIVRGFMKDKGGVWFLAKALVGLAPSATYSSVRGSKK